MYLKMPQEIFTVGICVRIVAAYMLSLQILNKTKTLIINIINHSEPFLNICFILFVSKQSQVIAKQQNQHRIMKQPSMNSQENNYRSFWTELDFEVERIGHKAKKNLTKFTLKKAKPLFNDSVNLISTTLPSPTIKQHENSPQQPTISPKEQLKQERSLKNRLRYLTIERQKQNRTVQLARIKYQKVKEVRTQKMFDKDELVKRSLQLDEEDISVKKKIVQKIKSDKSQNSVSLKSWQRNVSIRAEEVRKGKQQLRATALQRQNIDMAQKRKKIQSIQGELALSQQKISRAYMQKQAAVRNSRLLSQNQYLNHKKSISALSAKVKKQKRTIDMERSRNHSQLQHYREMLNISRRNQRTISSFYITSR